MPRRLLGLPASARQRRLVLALSATTLLLWIGASAILPLLPAYLRQRGSSTALVGLIMAAYFAASVLTQFPVGRLSDRLGRRPVVLGGLVVFAFGSVGFAIATAPAWAVVFRALQGVGAGAVTVASAAAIGTLVDLADRGGAFGALYGSQMLALALGPLVGSIVGGTSMRVLFLAAAVAGLAALLPVLGVLPPGRQTLVAKVSEPKVASDGAGAPDGRRAGRARRHRRDRQGGGRWQARERFGTSGRAYLGVLLVFATGGCLGGMYETCWTLLLRLNHAANVEIGLSWTLFALPFTVLSVPAGRLANRLDRRLLAATSMLWSAGFCALYPFLHEVGLLVGLGCLEAAGTVAGSPPALLVLSEVVPAERQGAAQGGVETARTAAMAGAAALSGALFGVRPQLPFELCGVIGVLGAVLLLAAWSGVAAAGAARGAGAAGAAGHELAASETVLLAAERGSAAPESPARGTPRSE